MKTVLYQGRENATKNWRVMSEDLVAEYRTRGYEVRELVLKQEAATAVADLTALVTDAQAILAKYLPPNGISKADTITALLELLDGPRARTALTAAGAL